MTDEEAPAPRSMAAIADVLRSLGVDDVDLTQAESDGTLVLLGIDHLALGQEVRYTVDEACERTGLPEEELRHIWRSLGLAEPPPGERMFTDVDLANLNIVAELLHSGAATPEVIYGMTRVVGSSMARVASALVDAISARAERALAEEPEDQDVPFDALASVAGGFLPQFPQVLDQVWRRHLQAAARRRLLRAEQEEAVGLVVGFADLVGFTALSQQVSDEELAAIVDQFEGLAYDIVVAGGGRVLKMIGDEVMFVVEDPHDAVGIALDLADASRDAADLSEVRAGLALGPVLEREGDAYGPTVNLASRITAIAYPGSVVVSPELRAALEDTTEDYTFRSMRPRFLKHIGRVSLSVVRRAGEGPPTVREALEERRRRVQEAVKERLG